MFKLTLWHEGCCQMRWLNRNDLRWFLESIASCLLVLRQATGLSPWSDSLCLLLQSRLNCWSYRCPLSWTGYHVRSPPKQLFYLSWLESRLTTAHLPYLGSLNTLAHVSCDETWLFTLASHRPFPLCISCSDLMLQTDFAALLTKTSCRPSYLKDEQLQITLTLNLASKLTVVHWSLLHLASTKEVDSEDSLLHRASSSRLLCYSRDVCISLTMVLEARRCVANRNWCSRGAVGRVWL